MILLHCIVSRIFSPLYKKETIKKKKTLWNYLPYKKNLANKMPMYLINPKNFISSPFVEGCPFFGFNLARKYILKKYLPWFNFFLIFIKKTFAEHKFSTDNN